jgi:hypothetical protein
MCFHPLPINGHGALWLCAYRTVTRCGPQASAIRENPFCPSDPEYNCVVRGTGSVPAGAWLWADYPDKQSFYVSALARTNGVLFPRII